VDTHIDNRAASDARRTRAKAVVATLVRKWNAGVQAEDEDELISRHADLLPELVHELGSARLVRAALARARKDDGRCAQPAFRILTDDELNTPIDFSGTGAGIEPDPRKSADAALPHVPGCLLHRRLSVGGQAAVYVGTMESTARTVAIKVMGSDGLSDSRQRARFEREVAILAKLRHPNVVDILDCGRTSDGGFFLIMPFIEGADLDAWWDQLDAESEQDTLRLIALFIKMCRAVEAAHSHNIVHRDLKPSNVRVDERGEPHVLDFGLARPAEDLSGRAVTVSGQILGSIPWASPEQAAGGGAEVDVRTDVYSLGVMLYQAFTGRFPYRVDGPLYEVLPRIAESRVPPPSSVPGHRYMRQKRSLDAVIAKALAKKPVHRYASAGLFADDLSQVLSGKVVEALPRPRILTWPRLFLLGSLALGVGALAWRAIHDEAAPPATAFELPAIQNSAGMRLVRIPGGVFEMGSPSDEPGRARFENRQRVTVRDFFISTTEVTQEQYQRVMGSPREKLESGANLPVQNVSWDNAMVFCRRLSEIERRSYRLPSEAEWEYACRAGTTTAFCSGNDVDAAGWHVGNSDRRLHPVSEKRQNQWGLFDMHGNLAEWCRDAFADPSLTEGKRLKELRVMRGGSYLTAADECRSAARRGRSPRYESPDTGLRVVLDCQD
jgi:formylglycine-generating enzyme required for sulfatase activity/tRNA A-37 threonylcarbamoyl transferase component Bud32